MLDDHFLNVKPFSGGAGRFFISVAGVSCAIISQDTNFLGKLRQRYCHFETSGPAEYEIISQFLPQNDLSPGMVAKSAKRSSRASIKRINSGNNFIIKQAIKPFLAVANTESKKVLVRICDSVSTFNNFLSALFNLILTHNNGLVLRTALVSHGDGASIFCRPRNSKKMPFKTSPQESNRADGIFVVKSHSRHFCVYSTPFDEDNNIERIPTRFRLNAVYSLKRDHVDNVVAIGGKETVPILFKNSSPHTDDDLLLNLIWETCRHITGAVSTYELRFRPYSNLWESLKDFQPENACFKLPTN